LLIPLANSAIVSFAYSIRGPRAIGMAASP
jgi:hypothetical protein